MGKRKIALLEKFADVITEFLDGKIDAEEFSTKYIHTFRILENDQDRILLMFDSGPLEQLFSDCDFYSDNSEELKNKAYISKDELLLKARKTLDYINLVIKDKIKSGFVGNKK